MGCELHRVHRVQWERACAPAPTCTQLVFPFFCTQAKEIERLNGVYNQILSKAGVEIIGAPGRPPALPARLPAASFPVASCLRRLASASHRSLPTCFGSTGVALHPQPGQQEPAPPEPPRVPLASLPCSSPQRAAAWCWTHTQWRCAPLTAPCGS